MKLYTLFEVGETYTNAEGEVVGEVVRTTIHQSPRSAMLDIGERVVHEGLAQAYVGCEGELIDVTFAIGRPDKAETPEHPRPSMHDLFNEPFPDEDDTDGPYDQEDED